MDTKEEGNISLITLLSPMGLFANNNNKIYISSAQKVVKLLEY